MKPAWVGLAAAGLLAGAGPAPAADAAAGRVKARPCAVCHGPDGVAVAPDAPNLAGQNGLYVVTQLRAYRDGSRRHEVMSLMARPLADADIDDLAAWYASIGIEVKKVP